MIVYVCPTCDASADPLNADESWRFSATGSIVEHVHDGIRSLCRKVEVVPAALARPGWRPRLAHVEHLLSTYVAAVEVGDRDAEMGAPDGDVVQALEEVWAMIDGDPARCEVGA